MEQIDKNLNFDEQVIIEQLCQKYQITGKNIKVLLKYYHHFSKIIDQQKNDRSIIKAIAEVSLIFTEKSNFYQTIQGRLFPGICFSMNDILKSKSHSEIQKITQICKQILSKVKLRQNILKIQVERLVNQIERGLQEAILFQKLCLLFYKNTLQISKEFQNYKEKLITFSWYLYIDAKHSCLNKNQGFQEKKFLMISVLQTIILNSLSHISPLILQKSSPKRLSYLNTALHKKQLMSSILQILLQESFTLKSSLLQYQKINSIFYAYFDYLIENSAIKSFSEENFDFLCNRSLDINFGKIDRKISKEIESNEIDLRKFIYYQMSNQNNDHKKTAIEDKLIVKHNNRKKQKAIKPSNQSCRKFKSHRVLDLDKCQLQMSSSSIINQGQIVFPSHIAMQAPRMSIPILHQMTEKNQLSKFILQKTRPYISQIRAYQPSIISFIETTLEKINKQPNNSNQQINISHDYIYQSYQFYSYFAQKIWIDETLDQNQKYLLEQTDSTHQCLLIIAIGTIILNMSQNENAFEKIIEIQNVDLIDLLYACIYVEQMAIPQKLQYSLNKFISQLVNQHIWNDQNFIEEIISATQQYIDTGVSTSEKQAISCILLKVQNYVNSFIQYFKNHLHNGSQVFSYNELIEWKQKSLNLSLIMLVFCPQILYERCLDQIILCNMYGSSKLLKKSIKFHELISIYKKLINKNQILLEMTILDVKSNLKEEETFKDIIQFYNTQFISYLNFAVDISLQKKNEDIIGQLIRKDLGLWENNNQETRSTFISPLKSNKQPIILSPRLRKNRSPIHQLNLSRESIQQSVQKQNIHSNMNNIINLELNDSLSGQLGIYSYVYEQENQSKGMNNHHNHHKLYINFQLNDSRNPTRIKQRKPLAARVEELCVTQRAKHPIFQEFRQRE